MKEEINLIDIMNIRNEFKSKIKELTCPDLEKFDCTIGRLMQTLEKKYGDLLAINTKGIFISYVADDSLESRNFLKTDMQWKLTKENGEECTDDDQSDETIEALLNLLKE